MNLINPNKAIQKISFPFLMIALFFLTLTGTSQASPLIKVKILESKVVRVGSTGSYQMRGETGNYSLNSSSILLRATLKGIKFNSKIWGKKIWIVPQENSFCIVDGRRYRGKILIFQKSDVLQVINELSLEDYLYGVIRWEINPNWPLASVAAQAIVARTYAFRKISNPSFDRDYHLTNTVKDQMYGGVESEDSLARIAVDLTRGEILIFQGELVQAYYYACCGGYSASSFDVWGEDLSYLQAMPREFCKESPHYHWMFKIKIQELKKIFEGKGLILREINQIKIVDWDKGGRVGELFIDSSEDKIYLTGGEFRSLIGYNKLKSTLFKVEKKGNYFIFVGKGWGHGVGMCQWGAKVMAEKGYGVDEILKFYYPSTEIDKVY
ncbi:SpoIID/LytB domain-containing protein [Patescibacteria group bacterium]|nr:SpoIID/LytB domain-containing protein [Patescibacteria group bacterium]